MDLFKFKGEVPTFRLGTVGVSLRRDRRYIMIWEKGHGCKGCNRRVKIVGNFDQPIPHDLDITKTSQLRTKAVISKLALAALIRCSASRRAAAIIAEITASSRLVFTCLERLFAVGCGRRSRQAVTKTGVTSKGGMPWVSVVCTSLF
jgi:hypothetical protein